MAEPLSEEPIAPVFKPGEISTKNFSTTRKGFDPSEVRRYLDSVADALRDAQTREADMRKRLGKAVRRAEEAKTTVVKPSEAELAEYLGSEVARVIESARTAAEERTARSIDEAEAIIAKAKDTAAEMMAKSKTVLDERTGEAEAAAKKIIDAADSAAADLTSEADDVLERARDAAVEHLKEAQLEGDGIVEQAESARKQVLKDMDRRRRSMRAQVERLKAARDRLIESHAVVQGTLDDATQELKHSIIEAKVQGETAARRAGEAVYPTHEDLESEIADAATIGKVELPGIEFRKDIPVERVTGRSESAATPEVGANATVAKPAVKLPGADSADAATAGPGDDTSAPKTAQPAQSTNQQAQSTNQQAQSTNQQAQSAEKKRPVSARVLKEQAEAKAKDSTAKSQPAATTLSAQATDQAAEKKRPVSARVLKEQAEAKAKAKDSAKQQPAQPNKSAAVDASKRVNLGQATTAKTAKAEKAEKAEKADTLQQAAPVVDGKPIDATAFLSALSSEPEWANGNGDDADLLDTDIDDTGDDDTGDVDTRDGGTGDRAPDTGDGNTVAELADEIIAELEAPPTSGHPAAGPTTTVKRLSVVTPETQAQIVHEAAEVKATEAPESKKPSKPKKDPVELEAELLAKADDPDRLGGIFEQIRESKKARLEEEKVAAEAQAKADKKAAAAAKKAQAKKPETKKPEAKKPETKKPETKKPEVKASEPVVEARSDEMLVSLRDGAISDLEGEIAKRLKRVLVDEQNVMLEAADREYAGPISEVLPDLEHHVDLYLDAIVGQIEAAHGAGAVFVNEAGDPPHATRSHYEPAIRNLVVEPIREQLVGVRPDADVAAATQTIRDFYREHKQKAMAAAASYIALVAFSRGSLAVADQAGLVRWVFVDDAEGCSAGRDNHSAGNMDIGDVFPSGAQMPPIAAGCRCLLVPTDS